MNYNLRFPVNQKSEYKPGDNVDFVMSFPAMSLLGNSVHLSGVLNVYKVPGHRVLATDKIYYDSATGINSFFNNVVVSSFTKGTIETQSDYPRWIKMKHTATKTASQLVTSNNLLTQLLCQDDSLTTPLMTDKLPFSVAVDCCLNNSVPTQDNVAAEIPYVVSGDVTLCLRLVQPLEALYGADVNAQVTYTITDFACEYVTKPQAPKPPQPTMLINYSVKQIINSSNAVVNVKLPAIINRMSSSFMKVSEELQYTLNNLELERPKGIDKLYYTFNDSTNTFITYPIESIEDILQHYLESFQNPDVDMSAPDAVNSNIRKNNATLRKIIENKLFGVGLDLETNLSLQNTSLGVQIHSQVETTDPYYMYAYFKGVISL